MHKLELLDIDTEEHLRLCISGRRNLEKKKNLIKTVPLLLAAEVAYQREAVQGGLYSLSKVDTSPVDGKEYVSLYENHMVASSSRARNTYDQLILLAKGGVCPFCGHRDVSTLDHYLPKSAETGFPEFSLIPCNLIPACKDCNTGKSDEVVLDKDKQLLHPYYDDVEVSRWLFSKVNYSISGMPTFSFVVNVSDELDEVLRRRVSHHFERLKLGSLYSRQAGVELSNITYYLKNLYDTGGKDALLNHLFDLATSCEQVNKNSWQTAFYYACAEDQRFSTMDWYS